MGNAEYDLGEAELEALKVLWSHGPSTVRQVMDRLHERGRRVAYTTVLTFLSRLEQKGYVQSDKSDVAYVYRARVTRERVTRSRLKALLEQLYDGAAGEMALQLIRDERFTPEEVSALHKLIDELDAKNRKRR
jgi:predicted transcriptional regulator